MDNTHKEVLIELGKLTEAVNRLHNEVAGQNNSVAKHEARHANQDILNKQMTMTQEQMLDKLAALSENDRLNSDFRVGAKASLSVIKIIGGFVGIGNIIMFINMFHK